MDKAKRQLLEVVEIWPYLSTWQKYHLLILAMWWAKVVHPSRVLMDRMGLTEKVSRDWVKRLTITSFVILIFALIGLSVSNSLAYSLFVLFLAFICTFLAVFGNG